MTPLLNEMVERVDEQDRVLAVVGRGEAVRRGWLHRIAVTVCRDHEGRFLVQRRSGHLARFPGHYEVASGGAVAPGESYQEAASRELAEELGVRAPVRLLVKFLNRSGLSPHWLAVHEAVLGDDPRPDPDEVMWAGWLSESELLTSMRENLFTPDSHEVVRRYFAALERGARSAPPPDSLRVTRADAAGKTRFLALHDYGMGGLWWWIHARSAREVVETFAEVEVVDRRDAVERAETWDLAEVDIDAAVMPGGLAALRAQRDAQRSRPGFGALADRSVVYLRRRWEGEDDVDPAVYLMEVGPDGRRLRQVELGEDGTAIRSGPDDWPFNPPVVDLFDPGLVGMEISRDEFEAEWLRARHEDAGQ